MPLRPVLLVGALYAGSERGLAADIYVSRALDLQPLPVCTSLVMASNGVVTDITEVPADSVSTQIEHTLATHKPLGMKIGVLADHHSAAAVLDVANAFDGPVVLDIIVSGPSSETVLTTRGIDAVAERLGAATVVTLSKAAAELVTGASIDSLDDAQVAAQRIHNRGAKAVLIRCGSLPYRFYDAADDPGVSAGGDGAATELSMDLLYDGEDFALFEAPLLPEPTPDSASSALTLALLESLMGGATLEAAMQRAKGFATEAVRGAVTATSGAPLLPFPHNAD